MTQQLNLPRVYKPSASVWLSVAHTHSPLPLLSPWLLGMAQYLSSKSPFTLA